MALTKFEISTRRTDIKDKLDDLLLAVSWGDLARRYFNKPSSWFRARLDGMDWDGNEVEFTPEELQQLKTALNDLADRIRRAADNIKKSPGGRYTV